MMRSFTYPAKLYPEAKGAFTVLFADVAEAITSGTDRLDVLEQAADCLEEAIAGRIARGREIPPPIQVKRGFEAITLSGWMLAEASLYLALRESGTSQSELARRLGVDEKQVRRMLSLRHATKLTGIEEALALLGKRLVVSLESQAG